MIANDRLTIQLFTSPITYQDEKSVPVASTEITFPETPAAHPLNIQKWVSFVNDAFKKQELQDQSVFQFVDLDWTFYPYQYAKVEPNQSWIIKTVMMKLRNKSGFWLRLLGHWPILQMLGKSLNGDTLPMTQETKTIHTGKGTKNELIQQIFPLYATNDPDVTIPLLHDEDAALIIPPRSVFKGFIDGFMNNTIQDFSVALDSSEMWVYHNGDGQDSHSLHFHQTSAYVDVHSRYNSPGQVSAVRKYAASLYSKESYGIGPQQSMAFRITFPNYHSSESVFIPKVLGLGYLVHCHFNHESMNGMMQSYYIYLKRDQLFENPRQAQKPISCFSHRPLQTKQKPKHEESCISATLQALEGWRCFLASFK
jgi:hypothetical protein